MLVRWTWYIVVHIAPSTSFSDAPSSAASSSAASLPVLWMGGLRSFSGVSDPSKSGDKCLDRNRRFQGISGAVGDSCNCAFGRDDICVMNKGCLQGKTRTMVDMNIINWTPNIRFPVSFFSFLCWDTPVPKNRAQRTVEGGGLVYLRVSLCMRCFGTYPLGMTPCFMRDQNK